MSNRVFRRPRAPGAGRPLAITFASLLAIAAAAPANSADLDYRGPYSEAHPAPAYEPAAPPVYGGIGDPPDQPAPYDYDEGGPPPGRYDGQRYPPQRYGQAPGGYDGETYGNPYPDERYAPPPPGYRYDDSPPRPPVAIAQPRIGYGAPRADWAPPPRW